MQLVLDEVVGNLDWPHSLGAKQDLLFLHLALFVRQKELGLIKPYKCCLGISISLMPCRDLTPRKEKTTVKLFHTSSHMMHMLQFSIQAEKLY